VRRQTLPGTILAGSVTGALLVVIVAPVVVLLLGSVLDTRLMGVSSEQWVKGSGGLVTFKWFAYVLRLYTPMILFSLRLAILSVVLCLAVGVPGGYVLAQKPFRGSGLLEEAVLLPLSIPGITVSIALIEGYAVLRGRWWLVLSGHLVYTIPFMVRSVTSAVRTFDIGTLEKAAQTLGAGPFDRLRLVVLPSVRHAALIGSLLVFAISWGEFNVSYLLNTPLNQTYPAALYATFTFNSFQVSAAAATIFLAGVVPALLALQKLGGSETVEVEQGA
jgi:putative spermidine/putrescine transport system permease protein